MKPSLMDRIAQWHERMPQLEKDSFLRTMRNKPEATLQYIRVNLLQWKKRLIDETETQVECDPDGDPSTIFQHLKNHFAKELAEIPSVNSGS